MTNWPIINASRAKSTFHLACRLEVAKPFLSQERKPVLVAKGLLCAPDPKLTWVVWILQAPFAPASHPCILYLWHRISLSPGAQWGNSHTYTLLRVTQLQSSPAWTGHCAWYWEETVDLYYIYLFSVWSGGGVGVGGVHVEIRSQLERLGSLPSPCGSPGLNLGH